ncbi:BON domain-containing protein [Streptomyces sp. NPDC001834]|uniref:BON domain-containing protein n=1 Tax=Streptomyces sp. NPDC001834 TaxID=3364616 RepID=UPI0036B8D51B
MVDDAGGLAGIVSRGDLLRVFPRRDPAIREEITTDVLTRTLGVAPGAITVQVTGGRVRLSGTMPHGGLIPVAVRLCESVDGVVDVTHDLGAESDTAVGTSPR